MNEREFLEELEGRSAQWLQDMRKKMGLIGPRAC